MKTNQNKNDTLNFRRQPVIIVATAIIVCMNRKILQH